MFFFAIDRNLPDVEAVETFLDRTGSLQTGLFNGNAPLDQIPREFERCIGNRKDRHRVIVAIGNGECRDKILKLRRSDGSKQKYSVFGTEVGPGNLLLINIGGKIPWRERVAALLGC